MTGNPTYFKEAAEHWNTAAEATLKHDPSFHKVEVAKMYTDWRDSAEKNFRANGGSQDKRVFSYKFGKGKDSSWYAKEGDKMSPEEWAKFIEKNPGFKNRKNLGHGTKRDSSSSGGLEGSLAVLGIISGIFFLSSNITGNAIANMTNSASSFLGAGLLIVGLIAGAFFLKTKAKK